MVALSVEGLLAYGPLGLFIVAFTESTVFPIPPDVILLPLAMMSPRMSWWYAFLTTAASVLGALVGYAVGRKAGRPALKRFFKEEAIQQVETLFVKYGGWAVGIAAFTPIPFKIFTFGAGIFRVPLLTFTVVSTVGRGARFFSLAAMVYFLGDRAQDYLGTNFEVATLILTAVLLLATWLLPKMIPAGRKALDGSPPSTGPSWLASAYRNLALRLRGLGQRALAWATASAILAVFAAAFLEDVAGPERQTLNATLGPLFGRFDWIKASAIWRFLCSPWVLGAVAVAGFAAYLAPTRRELFGRDASANPAARRVVGGTLAGLLAVGCAVEAIVRAYLPADFGPLLVLLPYLPAIGIYLLNYRQVSWWRKVGPLPAGIAAAAITVRAAVVGALDPAVAALSLLCSAFMFCLTVAALSALPSIPPWPRRPR